MGSNSSSIDEFASALTEFAPRYDVRLSTHTVSQLQDYYELLMFWNTRLHLVAPCSPLEFATRHVLESLIVLPYLTEGSRIFDVGSGAGLPIIPCLIARPGLQATLIESSQRKAIFLRETLRRIGTQATATVLASRFEVTPAPEADFVTCRALERLRGMFETLLNWSPSTSTLLIFAGEALREEITKFALAHQIIHIPESMRRFLYVVKKKPQATSPKSQVKEKFLT